MSGAPARVHAASLSCAGRPDLGMRPSSPALRDTGVHHVLEVSERLRLRHRAPVSLGKTSCDRSVTVAAPSASPASPNSSMRSAWCSLMASTRPGTSSKGLPCAGRPCATPGSRATRSRVARYDFNESPFCTPDTCGVIVGSTWSPESSVPGLGIEQAQVVDGVARRVDAPPFAPGEASSDRHGAHGASAGRAEQEAQAADHEPPLQGRADSCAPHGWWPFHGFEVVSTSFGVVVDDVGHLVDRGDLVRVRRPSACAIIAAWGPTGAPPASPRDRAVRRRRPFHGPRRERGDA